MTVCDFCGVTSESAAIVRLERVAICRSCSEAFSHQLGHDQGLCSNCLSPPESGVPLHGEGPRHICDDCLAQVSAESEEAAPDLTHLDAAGAVHMVDVGAKDVTARRAEAEAVVTMPAALAERFFTGDLPKGDAAATVRLAGTMAAKRTAELIPLAHPLALTSTSVHLEPHPEGVRIVAECATNDRTGVEMEALTAVSVAALTLYDMVKSIERGVVIGGIRLLSKAGGRSGDWEAESRSSLFGR